MIVLAIPVLLAATPLPSRTSSYVYDGANVIDDAAERELEGRHRELFARTGVAIVVITVPRLVVKRSTRSRCGSASRGAWGARDRTVGW
jgi:uncharacterized membrane protein YgcG